MLVRELTPVVNTLTFLNEGVMHELNMESRPGQSHHVLVFCNEAGRWGPAIEPVSDTLMFEQNLHFEDWRPVDFKYKLRLLKVLMNQ